MCFRKITHNGYVYETFGISKHFPVKLQLLLIRAEKLDNTLTAKCFIYDVGCCPLLFKINNSYFNLIITVFSGILNLFIILAIRVIQVEIGRASCRERVYISVVAVSL